MVVLQKIKNRTELPDDSATLGIYQKELKAGSRGDICTPMCVTALFTKAKRWKQLKCPLKDKWINKIWCVHIYNVYLSQATTW